MRKLFLIFIFLIGITVTVLGLQVQRFFHHKAPTAVHLTIPNGASLSEIATLLKENRLIANESFFIFYSYLTNNTDKFQAGDYPFPQGIGIEGVVRALKKGRFVESQFTIPEGYRLNQIHELLIKNRVQGADQFLNLVSDKKFIQSLGIKANSLEGYLFPDTYAFNSRSTTKGLIKKMVANFKRRTKPYLGELGAKKLSVHQWVTFASIVEKETGRAFERPLIAGVFWNRLKKDMLLQTDPTVIYGIKNFDGNLTRSHLRTDHPYNTYTRKGLPPGPIASPGLAALKAILKPKKTNYLYFVSKGDGTHYFSETLKQHQKAVRYYQLKKGPKP